MRILTPAVLLTAFFLTLACSPKSAPKMADSPVTATEPNNWDGLGKPVTDDPEDAEGEQPLEYVYDDLVVRPDDESAANPDSLAPYNPSHTFEHDLLHTKIEISFDWAKRHAFGKATLTMRPWFYPTDRATLDAKGFDIHGVTFDGQAAKLKYDYNGEVLVVQLGKTLTRNDEFKLHIEYTAKPDERQNIGGSAAITSDKGLYFINPDGSEGPDKPRQIWTQGETESNSCWFPTVDKPNERCTQEMYITVEDKYKTLSNGVLANQKKNPDGTRTDYWKMDKPHAPYLFMMAIGEFAVVKDKWKGLDLDYYVEPKYEPHARDIFPHTPEMLDFFSNKLGYPYPWQKYAQVVVRDYVSGAMENTTGVIFGDYVQLTKRELLDNHLTNEKVVAHEMFHHWFGDLVTTESWANLTLNEGFANYSEYLWLEHKYGRDEADYHEMQEQQGYIFSAMDGGHPLIHFGYGSREDMFDAHSYNKGGATLHMLRDLVGDEAFWTALNRYLKKNEYTDVEADELRMAFEDVTGQDLNWFWNQWYFGAGHPTLDIGYNWVEATNEMVVSIRQTQQPAQDVARVFDLPLAIDIYEAAGKVRRETVRLTQRDNAFVFKCLSRPALVNVDAQKSLLCLKKDDHTAEEWAFMYRNAPLFRDRWEALEGLSELESPLAKQVYAEALSDKFYGIRQRALDRADLKNPASLAALAKMAESDPEPSVKAGAIMALAETEDKKYVPIFQKNLNEKEAYSVVGASLSALTKLDPAGAAAASKPLENDENEGIIIALAEIYAASPDASKLDWFKRRSEKIDNMAAFAFFDFYTKYLIGLNDPNLLSDAVTDWKNMASDMKTSQWRRFSGTKAIADLRNHYREKGNEPKMNELEKVIGEIKSLETDPTLKVYYDMF